MMRKFLMICLSFGILLATATYAQTNNEGQVQQINQNGAGVLITQIGPMQFFDPGVFSKGIVVGDFVTFDVVLINGIPTANNLQKIDTGPCNCDAEKQALQDALDAFDDASEKRNAAKQDRDKAKTDFDKAERDKAAADEAFNNASDAVDEAIEDINDFYELV
ncbi:MAG: hypothetical protein IH946_05570, partial [Bacteroidetes bacterium]|nr:hypothetical protein [Bacteroidota bacterium]